MTLESSVVIFQALEYLWPQWSQQPQQPQWPQWPQQPHFIKTCTDPDGWIIRGTKMTNNGPFLWNGSSKIQFFTNIWHPFCQRLLRQADANFENWLMKHKWVTLVTMQPEIYYQNYQSFYPSELFILDHFIMRHPVFLFSIQEYDICMYVSMTSDVEYQFKVSKIGMIFAFFKLGLFLQNT